MKKIKYLLFGLLIAVFYVPSMVQAITADMVDVSSYNGYITVDNSLDM